jgi:hypothetical protein
MAALAVVLYFIIDAFTKKKSEPPTPKALQFLGEGEVSDSKFLSAYFI